MIPNEVFVQSLLGLLGPVRCYLEDASVSEIMINGPEHIYVERGGKLERVDARFASEEALWAVLRNIAQFTGKQIDERHPILEGRLPDGSRVQAIVPPAAFSGPTIAIRRFSKSSYTLDSLVEIDSLSAPAAVLLEALVCSKLNIAVGGGTGSGKTSLLNTLSRSIPESERIVVIEDSKEVQLEQQHVVYLEARPPDARGHGMISIRELFRATLRMRPDRIVIGEIRGGEALDIVQAMVSGHGGCLGTLHATYPRDTMTRLETMAMMSDVELPLAALRLQIASGLNFIVQVGRLPDGSRKVTHITEVLGYDVSSMKYLLQDIFVRDFVGKGADGRILTDLHATGAVPSCMAQLREHGFELPEEIFRVPQRTGRSVARAQAGVL
jgi:pilus assembly protein CpaF